MPKIASMADASLCATSGARRGRYRVIKRKPGGSFTVDKTFDQVSADYDALIVPGGTVGADKLRGDAGAVRLIRGFFGAGKPAGVICHGPWTLVEADVVRGRPGPGDQPWPARPARLRAKIVEEFAEGKHTAQARSA